MRIIAHIDMDAFFAAIEERDNPRVRGLPLVVGADPKEGKGRGVVSTANYKARAYGIRSALPVSTAWRLSEEAKQKGLPPVVFMIGSMRKYGEVSRRIMAILHAHAEHVEEASVDEAYIDLSFTGSYAKAIALCKKIKKEIQKKERLTASAGLGPNKLIAKIASDRQKPDGLTVVREEDAESFLEPLSIRTIPGVGPKTEQKFNKLGIHTIKEMKRFSRDELSELMGKWGSALYSRLRGKDETPLVEEWEAKSLGEQETFEKDSRDASFVFERLNALCAKVHRRFVKHGFKTFRTIAITVRFSDFTTKSRAATLGEPSTALPTLQFEALKLLMPFFDARENPKRKAIRLIGVRLEKLE